MLRRVTAGYAVNELGNWLGEVALAVAVFDHTRSAVATAALFVSVRFLPAVAVTAVVAWLESLERPRVVASLYAAQAVTTAGLALLVLHPVLAPILALGAVDGLAGMAARALLRGSISQQSADDDTRRRAMGRLNSVWALTFAIGPAAGGVLCSALGPSTVLLLDVASFAITAWVMLVVPSPQTDVGRERISERLLGVVRHLSSNGALAWLLGTEALATVFFAAVVPVEIVLVKSVLHGGDSGYGALLAAWGAGTVAGSAIFARSRSRALGSLLTVSTLAVAVGYLGIGASSVLWVACVFAGIGGVGNGVQWIALITAVQAETPHGLQARLMAVVEAIGALFPAIGFALGGAVAAIWSPRFTFVMAGSAAALSAVAFGLLAVRARDGRRLLAANPPE
jgi:predicted MFS family arabinose efflux permease